MRKTVRTLLKDVEFTLEKMKNDDNGNTVADTSFGTLKGKTNGHGKLMWKEGVKISPARLKALRVEGWNVPA